MKISDLISRLEAVKAEHGDVPVFHDLNNELFAVSLVTFLPGEPSGILGCHMASIACVVLEDDGMDPYYYLNHGQTADEVRQAAENIGTEREQDPSERTSRHAP